MDRYPLISAVIPHVAEHAAMITIFVFAMMVFVDYIEIITQGRMSRIITGGTFRQYSVAALLGSIPGCLGSFMNISFYVHGLLSFGAIVGGMVATSGDEAFVMLALFPQKAVFLFGVLFVTGIVSAYLSDRVASFFKIKPCEGCRLTVIHHDQQRPCFDFPGIMQNIKRMSLARFLFLSLLSLCLYAFVSGIMGPETWEWERITFVTVIVLSLVVIVTASDHYLEEHIWAHIAKNHLWKIFVWTFIALLVVEAGLRFWDLERFVSAHLVWVLLIGALLGLIPESGPHLIIVTLFAKGLVPFSVLLTSCIVQDGHGILPLLSYSVKDSVLIKVFNLGIGLTIGGLLYAIGI